MKSLVKGSVFALATFAALSSAKAESFSFNNHVNKLGKFTAPVNTYNFEYNANEFFMNANGKFKVDACKNDQTNSINFYVRRINLNKASSKDAEAKACIRGVLAQARIDAAGLSDRTLSGKINAVEAALPN